MTSVLEIPGVVDDLAQRLAVVEKQLAVPPVQDTIGSVNTTFINAKGQIEPIPVGMNWRGAWNSPGGYAADDVVKYRGHLYICTQPVPESVGGLLSPALLVPIKEKLTAMGLLFPEGGAGWGEGVFEQAITPQNRLITNPNFVNLVGGRCHCWQFQVERKALGEEVLVEPRLWDALGNELAPKTALEEAEGEWIRRPRNMLYKFAIGAGETIEHREPSERIPNVPPPHAINLNTASLWPGGVGVEKREFVIVLTGGKHEPTGGESGITLPQGYTLSLSSPNLREPIGVGNPPPTVDTEHWERVTGEISEGGSGAIGKAEGSAKVQGELTLPAGAPGVIAKLEPNTVDWDISSWWNGGTHRFTPQKAGIYFASCAFQGFETVPVGGWTDVTVAKNGTSLGDIYARNMSSSASAGPEGGDAGLVKMNGSTDYLELWGGAHTGTGASVKGAAFLAVAYHGHE
jgi:hypothetical protein